MKKRTLALILALILALSVAIPGTLAVSLDDDSSVATFSLDGEAATDETEATADETPVADEVPADDTDADEAPVEEPAAEGEEPAEGDGVPADEGDEAPADEVPAEGDEADPEGEVSDDAETEDDAEETEAEEEPNEQLPPEEDLESGSLAGAVAFTNVAPLMESFYGISTLDLYGTSLLTADTDNGVVLNKTAKANDDGSFTITLEVYATGEQTTESHYDPADIVLVLDTSGSMNFGMSDEDYGLVYGDLSKVNEDGVGNTTYTSGQKSKPLQYAYGVTGHDSADYTSNYYTYFMIYEDEYIPIWYYGSTGWIASYANEISEDYRVYPKVSNNDNGTRYTAVTGNLGTQNTYYVLSNGSYVAVTYKQNRWQDSNGNEYNANSTTFYSEISVNVTQFYKVKNTRLASLKTAVNSFISNVLETSPESSIAIVPFGGSVGTTTAFTSNETTLTNAVNALTATGATNSGAAMTTAASTINSLDSSHSDHKKVVVMFTDGAPCTTGTAFDSDVANTAISQSKTMKGNGVTVYTVGVVDGANGALSSMGTSGLNTYMHSVSSNYPDASSMTNPGEVNENLNGDSYYLTATNSDELKNIFVKISQQVGGADNTALDSSTVIKDIVAPSFKVPENASDIKVYTADCTGAGLTFDERTKATGVTTTITGDTIEVTGFNFAANWCGSHSGTYSGKKLIIEFTVSPKDGFLGGNNVATNGSDSGVYDKDGNLIGTFPQPEANVTIKNNDTTIESNVYLGGYYGQTLTGDQIRSKTEITIGGVELDLSKDGYGLEEWQTEYVKIEVTIKGENGQTFTDISQLTDDVEYTVTVTIKPKEGMDGTGAKGDANKMTGKDSTASGKINVFKPELTYKDSTVYYGDTAPTDYSGNKTSVVWKHGTTTSTDEGVEMLGTVPTLDITYTPEAGKIVDGKIATKQDIPVDVTVKIGDWPVNDYVTFVHTDCTGKSCGKPDNGKFWLHVKTCSLTITKAAGANTTIGNDEYFVFNVKKDDADYTQVVIKGTGSVTLKELPVGSYTVEEDASTAWRYTSSVTGGVTLSSTTNSGTITVTNTKTNDKWLNHFAQVINTYGKTN